MHLILQKLENTMHSDFDCYRLLQVGGGMNKLRLLRGVCKDMEIVNLNFGNKIA
jgi:hypothetical protein